MERITERALAQDITPSPTIKPPLLVLSQTEFDASVRQALRDLRRPDLLARNPLLRTRLVHDRAGDEASAATLGALVREAIETLREHPRDDKLLRAVERTYVRRPPLRSEPQRRSGCRSARTAAISPRVWIESWDGCGTGKSTASTTEHNWTASALQNEQGLGAVSLSKEVAAMNNTQIGDRAVVLGASMAGLLAAHVLAKSYGQVTLIDRDQLPETSMHRRGVPHGRHIHALAARGQQALEEMFPGLTAELVADGALVGSLLADARMYLSGHRLRQTDSGLVLLCASRPFLEAHVRARVRSPPHDLA